MMIQAIVVGLGTCVGSVLEPPLFDGRLVPSDFFDQAIGIDIDGDGQEDLLCAASDALAVHLTGSDGLPTPAVVTTVGESVREFASADLTGDAIADAAFTVGDGTGVMVRAGAGDGTFGPGSFIAVAGARGLAALDADLDGDVDLVVGAGSSVVVLLNDGAGGFTPGSQTALSSVALRIRAGDIDGDGVDDLGVLEVGDAAAYVLTSLSGDGAGGFASTSSRVVPEWSPDFRLADMNADGMLDAVVLRFEDEGFVDVFPGSATGFGAPVSSPTTSDNGVAIAVLDADGDGHLDALCSGSSAWELLSGDGAGGLATELFEIPGVLDGGVGVIETVAGTVLGLSRDEQLEVRTRVDGEIGTRILASSGDATAIGVGDVDADGDADIILGVDIGQARLLVYLQEAGGFADHVEYEIDSSFPTEISVGDLTGDGVPDIVVSLDGVPGLVMLEGVAGDVPSAPEAITGLRLGTSVSLADWDGDADLDLVAYGSFFQYGYDDGPGVFLNDGGELSLHLVGSHVLLGQKGQAGGVDYTGDGVMDLIASSGPGFFYGEDEGGGLTALELVGAGGLSEDLVTGDFDGDGLPDAARAGSAGVGLLLNADGAFSGETLISDQDRGDLHAADFDGDGDLDLAASGEHGLLDGSVDVELLINSGGAFTSSRIGTSYESTAMSGGDVNGDGRVDIVTGTSESIFSELTVVMIHEGLACPADFNGDGVLNILDFVAFQLGWQAQDPKADCDKSGEFQVLDFVCFQLLFTEGCD